jgi:hypothetical protein
VVLMLLTGFWQQWIDVLGFQGSVARPRLHRFTSTCTFRTANRPATQSKPIYRRRPNRDHQHRLQMTLDKLNDVQEEMLMCVQMQWISVADLSPTQTEALLYDYVRSFPFAAVLPVQPLTYLPTPGGVDVTFLRKKTATKPTNDGGIRFVLEPVQPSSLEQGADAEGTPSTSWILTARRNSEGQSVQKLFSEKLIVQELLDGLTGASQRFAAAPATTSAEQDGTTRTLQPRDVVQVTSVYHKWMSERK